MNLREIEHGDVLVKVYASAISNNEMMSIPILDRSMHDIAINHSSWSSIKRDVADSLQNQSLLSFSILDPLCPNKTTSPSRISLLEKSLRRSSNPHTKCQIFCVQIQTDSSIVQNQESNLFSLLMSSPCYIAAVVLLFFNVNTIFAALPCQCLYSSTMCQCKAKPGGEICLRYMSGDIGFEK